MPGAGPIQVEVAYAAMVTQGNGRTPWRCHLAATAPVIIPSVEATEAPVVIEASWPAGAQPERMAWREHGGALWRPLVSPDGGTLDDHEGFARGVEQARLPGGQRARDGWPDYPFNVVDPSPGLHGRSPFGAMREGDPGLRVKSDNREAAVAAAQRTAADDLLLIDGVLHMRSRAPVWAVGRRSRIQVDPGHVRLAIPDFKGHEEWFASYPLDRRDEAVAFASLHAERMAGVARWNVSPGEERPRLVEATVEVRHAGGSFPDTRAYDLIRVFEEIESNWRTVQLQQFDRRFLKAYGDIAGLVDAIEAEGPEATWPEEAEVAIRALVAAGNPDWPETWCYAAEVVEVMRSFAQRCEVAHRFAAEADAETIAALGR